MKVQMVLPIEMKGKRVWVPINPAYFKDEMDQTGVELTEFPVEHNPESEKGEIRKIWLSWQT